MADVTVRLLRLLTLLQSRPTWSGPELAERLDVSARGVRRDVGRLRELGYPVEAERGAGGGYRLAGGRALPPLVLDDEEAVAVALALRVATAGPNAGLGEASVRAMAKLDQVFPPRLRARTDAIAHAAVALEGGDAMVDPDVLVTLARGARERCEVRFGYAAASGERTERRVEPYRLVATARRWYLFAWDVDRGDWRTFRVDRAADVTLSTWRFTPRDAPDAAEYVARAVTRSPYRHVARVRVAAACEEVADVIPPSVGTLTPDGAGVCVLQTGADGLVHLAFHVSRLPWDFEVLDPPELREVLARMGERMLRAARGGLSTPSGEPSMPGDGSRVWCGEPSVGGDGSRGGRVRG